jgi:hypothetical protein
MKLVDPMLVAVKTKEGSVQVMLDPSQIGSAAAGGIILPGLARHFARALASARLGKSEEATMAEMLRLFQAEMDNPTDLGEGSIVN